MSAAFNLDEVVCSEMHLSSALFNTDYLPRITNLIENLRERVTLLEAFILLEEQNSFLTILIFSQNISF